MILAQKACQLFKSHAISMPKTAKPTLGRVNPLKLPATHPPTSPSGMCRASSAEWQRVATEVAGFSRPPRPGSHRERKLGSRTLAQFSSSSAVLMYKGPEEAPKLKKLSFIKARLRDFRGV
jgi:hypothetical protein